MTAHYTRGQEQDVHRALHLLERIADATERIAMALETGLTTTETAQRWREHGAAQSQ